MVLLEALICFASRSRGKSVLVVHFDAIAGFDCSTKLTPACLTRSREYDSNKIEVLLPVSYSENSTASE